jgi:hypothetical protein
MVHQEAARMHSVPVLGTRSARPYEVARTYEQAQACHP